MNENPVLHKRQFQIERIILFTDAVFAIAITLLVIEIKVPEFHNGETNQEVLSHLAHLMPKFIGYIISFMLIGIYWVVHHRMFGYLVDYDMGLIRLNLVYLMLIALMPFSSGFYSENFGRDIAFVFYLLNLSGIGLMTLYMWRYIGNPKRKIAEGLDDRTKQYFKWRSLAVTGVFGIGLLLCLFNHPVTSWASRFVFILIWPALEIVKKRFPSFRADGGATANA